MERGKDARTECGSIDEPAKMVEKDKIDYTDMMGPDAVRDFAYPNDEKEYSIIDESDGTSNFVSVETDSETFADGSLVQPMPEWMKKDALNDEESADDSTRAQKGPRDFFRRARTLTVMAMHRGQN